MMIIEVKNEPMSNLVLLIHVHIEPQDPHIKDENRNSSPSGKVPGERAVCLESDLVDGNNDDQQHQ